MPRYTITEPHPTVTQNTYVHAGRGGAGNFVRAPVTTPSAGVPTPITPTTSNSSSTSSSSSSSSTSSTRRFYSGRGGAGNAHTHIERPVLSFEDEFSRADKREMKAQLGSGYYVGRGGAGNFTSASGPAASGGRGGGLDKSRTSSNASVTSGESQGSVGSGILRRLSGAFRR